MTVTILTVGLAGVGLAALVIYATTQERERPDQKDR